MDIETYQQNEDALALLSILRIAEDDVAKGFVYSVDEVFDEIQKEIDEIQKETDSGKNKHPGSFSKQRCLRS